VSHRQTRSLWFCCGEPVVLLMLMLMLMLISDC